MGQAYDERLVVILQLLETAACRISSHVLAERPLIDCGIRSVQVLLVESRNTEVKLARLTKRFVPKMAHMNCGLG